MGEEDIKVATANIAVNEMIFGECAEGAAEVCPRPPLPPAFGNGRVSNTVATAVSSEGGRIESNMRMLMLSMQMQQTAQQISMQQQIFLWQMQMHMSAMEKHADTPARSIFNKILFLFLFLFLLLFLFFCFCCSMPMRLWCSTSSQPWILA
jgi:hypothetical protein